MPSHDGRNLWDPPTAVELKDHYTVEARLKAWGTAVDNARSEPGDYIHKLHLDRVKLQHAIKRIVGLDGQPSVPLLLRGAKALICIACDKEFVFNNWCILNPLWRQPKGVPQGGCGRGRRLRQCCHSGLMPTLFRRPSARSPAPHEFFPSL